MSCGVKFEQFTGTILFCYIRDSSRVAWVFSIDAGRQFAMESSAKEAVKKGVRQYAQKNNLSEQEETDLVARLVKVCARTESPHHFVSTKQLHGENDHIKVVLSAKKKRINLNNLLKLHRRSMMKKGLESSGCVKWKKKKEKRGFASWLFFPPPPPPKKKSLHLRYSLDTEALLDHVNRAISCSITTSISAAKAPFDFFSTDRGHHRAWSCMISHDWTVCLYQMNISAVTIFYGLGGTALAKNRGSRESWRRKNIVQCARSQAQGKNRVQWLCVGRWSFVIECGITWWNSILPTSWFSAVSIFLARVVFKEMFAQEIL